MRILGALALALISVLVMALVVTLVERHPFNENRALPDVDLTLDQMDFPANGARSGTTSLENEDAQEDIVPESAAEKTR